MELAKAAGLPDKVRRAADLALAALKAATAQDAELLLRVQDADRARCAPSLPHARSLDKHLLSENRIADGVVTEVHSSADRKVAVLEGRGSKAEVVKSIRLRKPLNPKFCTARCAS